MKSVIQLKGARLRKYTLLPYFNTFEIKNYPIVGEQLEY